MSYILITKGWETKHGWSKKKRKEKFEKDGCVYVYVVGGVFMAYFILFHFVSVGFNF